MFSHGVLPPLMFLGMVAFLLLGFPVAFSLAATGLAFAVIGILSGAFGADFLQALPFRLFGTISNELLLAIPFFTFMGAIIERCGLAEDLLEGMGELFGPRPGGLAVAVVLVGAIMGAITGTVAASVITMAMISLPTMLRTGYDPKVATGVIAASGTIAQLIPPSLVLIVLSAQMNVSVGDMYLGAIGPSLLQVLLFLGFIGAMAVISPHRIPPLPPELRVRHGWALARRVAGGMLPALGLMFLVLGTVFLGLATPTEAGAMGGVGALLLAALNRRLAWPLVREAMSSTMRITAMVAYILFGATVFSLTFQGVSGALWVEGMLHGLPGGQTGFLIFVMIFIFVLAFFLDFFEIAFIVVPLIAPVAKSMGIDLIWLGVMMSVNIQTSFMHPPFGVALFYLRGVAPPEVRSRDIYLGAIPWLCLQLMLVGLLIAFPQISTYWLHDEATLSDSAVEQRLEQLELPGLDGALPPLTFD